jgi:hypothetical protein
MIKKLLNRKEISMQRAKSLGIGLLLGSALMYILDPKMGRRRRALMRDKLNHYKHATQAKILKKTRDLRNRLQGAIAEKSSTFRERINKAA